MSTELVAFILKSEGCKQEISKAICLQVESLKAQIEDLTKIFSHPITIFYRK